MEPGIALRLFQFDRPEAPVSLYSYAPVFLVRDRLGSWVVKRTGAAHSDAAAIAGWTRALCAHGIAIVAPAEAFAPNPHCTEDAGCWVAYPYIDGKRYDGSADQLHSAGALLGRIHARTGPEMDLLRRFDAPPVRDAAWLDRHLATAAEHVAAAGGSAADLRGRVRSWSQAAASIAGLPLAGCSFDFRAANLVFAPHPVLVDPDHAACIPRLYDLAVALLLFHNDAPGAPPRLWSADEWLAFMRGYGESIALTAREQTCWPDVLRLAWLDQAVWLLGNFPEGWAQPKEARYLLDLVAFDPDRYLIG